MEYDVGTFFETPQGFCVIVEKPQDGTSSVRLAGCFNFWCATYEIKSWLKKDWRIVDTEDLAMITFLRSTMGLNLD